MPAFFPHKPDMKGLQILILSKDKLLELENNLKLCQHP